MPATGKTKWAQLKVGLMAIAALSILAVLIILRTSTEPLFRKTSEVITYVEDASSMAEGATPVKLNGLLIGKVKKYELSNLPDANRAIKVTLSIYDDKLTSVPVDSQVKLAQQNLLGARFIDIKRGKSAQTIQAGAEITSADSTELEDLFEQGNTTLAALQGILTRADNIISAVENGKGTIGKLLVDETLYNRFLAIVDEAHKLSVSLNSTDSTVGRLLHEDTLYQDIHGSVARINTMLDALNAGEGSAGKLLKDPALYDEARNSISDLRDLLNKVNNGQGDVGKLLNSDELHEQLKATLGRVDTLMDKISNGQGTVAQLLNNPQLYEDLDGMTRETQGLLKDFRSNPSKFLRVRVTLF